MADQVRKEVEERYFLNINLCGKEDFDQLMTVYTQDATVMADGAEPLVGQKAIKEALMKVIPLMRTLVPEKIYHFEQLTDDTAYTNGFFKQVDKDGNTLSRYQDSVVWKKVDGKWCYHREMFNKREDTAAATPAEIAKKEIFARNELLLDSFNKDDYDTAMSLYTEDATAFPPLSDPVEGRDAIRTAYEKEIPAITKIVKQETFHFELLNDTTAITNTNMKSVDKSGKTFLLFRDTLIWKKRDGKWSIFQDMYNERPLV